MKRDRLKPHVYKVQGAVNFAFYDMLKGTFYQFTPDGSVQDLRRYLLDEGLIFETEGIVPNNIIADGLRETQKNINLRVLQIRLNGREEDNCLNRTKTKNVKQVMQYKVLNKIMAECRFIPIETIRIEAEDDDKEMIGAVLRGFDCSSVELNIDNPPPDTDMALYSAMCAKRKITFSANVRKNPKELKVTIFNFFYNRNYNPCLGHQAAVDTGGEIKSCLWSDDVLGNIIDQNLKDLIISGAFDKYWELAKSKIDFCKDCELRFACGDCRVLALSRSGHISAKPPYCNYNPHTGRGTL